MTIMLLMTVVTIIIMTEHHIGGDDDIWYLVLVVVMIMVIVLFSHSKLLSPLSTTVRALHFYKTAALSSLVDSRRIACHDYMVLVIYDASSRREGPTLSTFDWPASDHASSTKKWYIIQSVPLGASLLKAAPAGVRKVCVSACTQKTPNLRFCFLKQLLTNTLAAPADIRKVCVSACTQKTPNLRR